MRVHLNIAIEGKKTVEKVSIDSDVLSHIFVTYSLALDKWAKESREKFQTELNLATNSKQRDSFLCKLHHFFDDLESCECRRKQADEVEEKFQNLLMDK